MSRRNKYILIANLYKRLWTRGTDTSMLFIGSILKIENINYSIDFDVQFHFEIKSELFLSKMIGVIFLFFCVDNENPTTTNIPCINVWQWKIFRANILIHEAWQWTTVQTCVQICQMKAYHSMCQSKRPIYNLSHCTKNHTHTHALAYARTLIEYLTTVHNFYGGNVFSARGLVNCCKQRLIPLWLA